MNNQPEFSKKSRWSERIKSAFSAPADRDILWENEIQANLMVVNILVLLMIGFCITAILSATGVFEVELSGIMGIFALMLVFSLVSIILCMVYKAQKHWLKNLLVLNLCLYVLLVYCALGSRFAIGMVIPVAVSARYLSPKLTRAISVASCLFLLIGTIVYAYVGLDYDYECLLYEEAMVSVPDASISHVVIHASNFEFGEYMRHLLTWSFVPSLMLLGFVDIICFVFAKRGREALIRQKEVAGELARVDTELSLATGIQASMMPKVFPDTNEIDLYAANIPAKEVGGDFYDFFFIDENTLGLVMADVSGKGVPAALFMMIGKLIIKNQALAGLSPAQVLTNAGNQLCENNDADLFITAWFGKLDLTTGRLSAANAGHEYPAIKRKDGDYEIVKDKHGMPLGTFRDLRYKEYELTMNPGDKLFLYTDGVTEATNSDQALFGLERTMDALNRSKDTDQRALIRNLKVSIDAFVKQAPQFDDITMLGICYRGSGESAETGPEAGA